MYLCSLVCSANLTLTALDVSHNPMSAAARKAIEVDFVLCQMRNPTVTEIDTFRQGFDDQDAFKIGEGLRFVLHIISICLLSRTFLFTKIHFFDVATPLFLVDKGHYQRLIGSQNASLTELQLLCNQIGDVGASGLGAGLAYVSFLLCG